MNQGNLVKIDMASFQGRSSKPDSVRNKEIKQKVDFIHSIVMDNSDSYWAWTSQLELRGQKKAIRKIFFDQKMKVKFTEKNIAIYLEMEKDNSLKAQRHVASIKTKWRKRLEEAGYMVQLNKREGKAAEKDAHASA